ncbi:MAG: metallophosphoesterase [Synechococcales cyanobacterium RM1_1_8]|nr:metallophosphoesterase [Synechococcales cyanobacterium RM1_1_8]
MKFVLDPSIQTKIRRMKARVRWRESPLQALNIDQTRLHLDLNLDITDDAAIAASSEGNAAPHPFSFLALGDSGSRSYYNDNPQRRVAEAMVAQSKGCRFVLHTGDVVYLVGSREQYPKNFIEPYREFLLGGESPRSIAYDAMCFRLPFLPVLGNHDYYDLPVIFGFLLQLVAPLRRLLRNQINLDIGWHGSFQGDAYARAFLDYLAALNDKQLHKHLQKNYTAIFNQHRCLRYQPGTFTRLPNRYYQFRQEGIDFFALDSNTFNAPLPLAADEHGKQHRRELVAQREENLLLKQALLQESLSLDGQNRIQASRLADHYAKLEQIEEQLRDIDKQLNDALSANVTDQEQLNWLIQGLIDSWRDEAARGRVLYFHHPPYVTETSKWAQGQTLAIRHRLRQVFDQVSSAVLERVEARSLVDLVICGHAHCFEYLQTGETGHGDRQIHWLVCGGSGFSLRRQRLEGPDLCEPNGAGEQKVVATSKLFIGRAGHGSQMQRPYSFARIEVAGTAQFPIYNIHPQVVERIDHRWVETSLAPITINTSIPGGGVELSA